ncbi:hypothetical protein F6476_07235 [Pseudomonas umsongensis]|jgi:hypothetical protein|uniref:hypothetical protein n=1 Tax=Pseudomonas umsongensis TaxID=198618 RepID=UPI001244F486|nr:hypothetical protein [Pseudomonas umsongensis]QFG29013.1 hypothetical protein F6476_07235 [Pseudomonas umsongensis]
MAPALIKNQFRKFMPLAGDAPCIGELPKAKVKPDSTVQQEERPGLKVHLCSLVAPDSPAGQRWMPVYVHSKLMIIDELERRQRASSGFYVR